MHGDVSVKSDVGRLRIAHDFLERFPVHPIGKRSSRAILLGRTPFRATRAKIGAEFGPQAGL